ncbi:hypothetical protein FRB94_002853 [Tulasnella sp. JGI-2019a]|nr:hypothetical protein FRB93_011320 [Tulasnella sp. JGI-2019a]KAG9003862.1 hypothetical protein FRB94_002853 [Tulasnella sp. JGI-2019a]KAG9036886.1 hypothetical protein FRB95_007731 [Tulasnella sp. JGI-2019a]
MPPDVVYGRVTHEELSQAIILEEAGFHPDEAASLERFQDRQANAPEYFLGAYIAQNPSSAGVNFNPLGPRRLIGYVCATVAASDTLTEAAMKTHVSVADGGVAVCIHSVCVDMQWRRQGVAVGLLKEFIRRCKEETNPKLKAILLICHEELIHLYRKADFELVGKSDVVHGPREWYEMRHLLRPSKEENVPGVAPRADVLAALLAPRSKEGTVIRPFTSFPTIQDLVFGDAATGTQSNKFKIACPRPGCGSLILLARAAQMVEASAIQLDSPSDPPPPSTLTPLPSPPTTIEWWLVSPDPMQFENIGFSKPVAQPGKGEGLKLLSCAECDLGPLGWHKVGSSEFWLACSRVSYIGSM